MNQEISAGRIRQVNNNYDQAEIVNTQITFLTNGLQSNFTRFYPMIVDLNDEVETNIHS